MSAWFKSVLTWWECLLFTPVVGRRAGVVGLCTRPGELAFDVGRGSEDELRRASKTLESKGVGRLDSTGVLMEDPEDVGRESG